jgi:hypothetical protein
MPGRHLSDYLEASAKTVILLGEDKGDGRHSSASGAFTQNIVSVIPETS